jgi:pimeloyl-ACP methyl ester carboxylesterase
VLAIQGTADPYCTVLHFEAVRDGSSGPVELLVLDCAHAPHLEATEPVTAAVVRFLAGPAGAGA